MDIEKQAELVNRLKEEWDNLENLQFNLLTERSAIQEELDRLEPVVEKAEEAFWSARRLLQIMERGI